MSQLTSHRVGSCRTILPPLRALECKVPGTRPSLVNQGGDIRLGIQQSRCPGFIHAYKTPEFLCLFNLVHHGDWGVVCPVPQNDSAWWLYFWRNVSRPGSECLSLGGITDPVRMARYDQSKIT